MEWIARYRRHLSGAEPIAGLLLILKVAWGFRLFCFGLAAAVIAFGIWTALTVEMRFGASMGLIIFPGAAILISMVGICAYGVAQLFLSPNAGGV